MDTYTGEGPAHLYHVIRQAERQRQILVVGYLLEELESHPPDIVEYYYNKRHPDITKHPWNEIKEILSIVAGEDSELKRKDWLDLSKDETNDCSVQVSYRQDKDALTFRCTARVSSSLVCFSSCFAEADLFQCWMPSTGYGRIIPNCRMHSQDFSIHLTFSSPVAAMIENRDAVIHVCLFDTSKVNLTPSLRKYDELARAKCDMKEGILMYSESVAESSEIAGTGTPCLRSDKWTETALPPPPKKTVRMHILKSFGTIVPSYKGCYIEMCATVKPYLCRIPNWIINWVGRTIFNKTLMRTIELSKEISKVLGGKVPDWEAANTFGHAIMTKELYRWLSSIDSGLTKIPSILGVPEYRADGTPSTMGTIDERSRTESPMRASLDDLGCQRRNSKRNQRVRDRGATQSVGATDILPQRHKHQRYVGGGVESSNLDLKSTNSRSKRRATDSASRSTSKGKHKGRRVGITFDESADITYDCTKYLFKEEMRQMDFQNRLKAVEMNIAISQDKGRHRNVSANRIASYSSSSNSPKNRPWNSANSPISRNSPNSGAKTNRTRFSGSVVFKSTVSNKSGKSARSVKSVKSAYAGSIKTANGEGRRLRNVHETRSRNAVSKTSRASHNGRGLSGGKLGSQTERLASRDSASSPVRENIHTPMRHIQEKCSLMHRDGSDISNGSDEADIENSRYKQYVNHKRRDSRNKKQGDDSSPNRRRKQVNALESIFDDKTAIVLAHPDASWMHQRKIKQTDTEHSLTGEVANDGVVTYWTQKYNESAHKQSSPSPSNKLDNIGESTDATIDVHMENTTKKKRNRVYQALLFGNVGSRKK